MCDSAQFRRYPKLRDCFNVAATNTVYEIAKSLTIIVYYDCDTVSEYYLRGMRYSVHLPLDWSAKFVLVNYAGSNISVIARLESAFACPTLHLSNKGVVASI